MATSALVANGLIMPFILINDYVRPYQRATDTLTADGSIQWLTGDALLALSWFAVYTLLALFAIKVVLHSY